MKTILITGSNGFVGSHLVDKALEKGFKVYAAVRRSSELTYLKDKAISLIYLDYSDPISLKHSLSELGHLDYVIHNAGVTLAAKDHIYDQVNNQYTRSLLNALIGLKIKRFLYISSLAAIGAKEGEPLIPITDSDKPNPNTAYGKSKRMAELFLQEQNSINYTILRPTAIYGPRDKDFPTLFNMINAGFEIYPGSKKSMLSFIYITDLVEAVFFALEKEEATNESFIVSDGSNYSPVELNRFIKVSLNKKFTLSLTIPKVMLQTIAQTLELMGQNHMLTRDKVKILTAKNWQANCSKFMKLGFEPRFSLKEGIIATKQYLYGNQQ